MMTSIGSIDIIKILLSGIRNSNKATPFNLRAGQLWGWGEAVLCLPHWRLHLVLIVGGPTFPPPSRIAAVLPAGSMLLALE